MALRRQGYVETDKRLRGRVSYWRLRFRQGGALRTIYLGTDAQLVGRVRAELESLQSYRRRRRQLTKAVVDGGRMLRRAKRQLAPVLSTLGLRYHGDALRKVRKTSAP